MTYRIVVSELARSEIDQPHAWIAARSPQNAERWHEGIFDAIESLRTSPRRFRIAVESALFECEIRQLVFRSHRVLFTVRDATVIVISVRHGSRQPLTPEELQELMDRAKENGNGSSS